MNRWVGWLALAAAPVTLAGLLLGISLVDWDAEAYRDPAVVLAIGADDAGVLRVSYLLTALGSYVMLVPLALWLRAKVADPDPVRDGTTTVAGLAYLGLGAAGACVLGAVIPELIRLYGESGADHETLETAWHTANRIGEDGLQGMVQNLAGAAWWLLLGTRLRLLHKGIGGLTLLLGVASAVNAVGSLFELDALQVPGLTVTVLGAPVWSFLLGLWVLRKPQLGVVTG
ncbi:MAG: hypothetical protein ABR549_11410 [Mycobacteriales bacterium]